jgi:ankyrin repeat protein
MAKAKKKLLPKNFEDLLKLGDLEVLTDVFDTCELNARGGVFKQTALAFNDCPDELARWLVDRGADISATDSYGETPLHSRARHWKGRIEILLELGADIHNGENLRGTPLHTAAGSHKFNIARVLVEHGARIDALNSDRQTPLVYALQRCSNTDIEAMAMLAELLHKNVEQQKIVKKTFLSSIFGTQQMEKSHTTSEMKTLVTKIGTEFEFHRSNFNLELLEGAKTGLDKLYRLFEVTPVPGRAMHDGKSPIIAKTESWQKRHQEFWELLVPSSGAANTIQGEVIRISGKIRNELEGNGGVNWDSEFKKMADSFLLQVSSDTPLSNTEISEAKAIVAEVKARRGDTSKLCELAVNWVILNPRPKILSPPDYNR